MKYLVDANVLCEPTKPSPHPGVIEWLSMHESDLVVDPVVLGEMLIGILTLSRGRKRTQLEQWFDAVVHTVACVPWDSAISRQWAQLVVDLKKKGRIMPLLDSMIAATALELELTVVTRNTFDFNKADVPVLNPFV